METMSVVRLISQMRLKSKLSKGREKIGGWKGREKERERRKEGGIERGEKNTAVPYAVG